MTVELFSTADVVRLELRNVYGVLYFNCTAALYLPSHKLSVFHISFALHTMHTPSLAIYISDTRSKVDMQ